MTLFARGHGSIRQRADAILRREIRIRGLKFHSRAFELVFPPAYTGRWHDRWAELSGEDHEIVMRTHYVRN